MAAYYAVRNSCCLAGPVKITYANIVGQDPTLKRCFGVNKRVADCDWKYLSSLRTLQAPHVPMPTLVDLLEYLAAPENTGVWVLLDIKVQSWYLSALFDVC